MHASLCDQLTDLVQNSLEAGANRVEVLIEESGRGCEIRVADDGAGMSEEVRQQVLSPFYTDGKKHASRRVGLGLPFLEQVVEATGGELKIESEKGRGTTVWFWLDSSHVDCPPLGDVAGCVTGLLTFSGKYELIVERRRHEARYRVSRTELAEALGELETAASLKLIWQYVASNEEALA
jgi:hypothetical protein